MGGLTVLSTTKMKYKLKVMLHRTIQDNFEHKQCYNIVSLGGGDSIYERGGDAHRLA